MLGLQLARLAHDHSQISADQALQQTTQLPQQKTWFESTEVKAFQESNLEETKTETKPKKSKRRFMPKKFYFPMPKHYKEHDT